MAENNNVRLKEVMRKTGYTMVGFSEKINVSRQTLYNISSKGSNPGFEVLCGLATNFPWLSLRWFITGEGTMNIESEGKTLRDMYQEIVSLQEQIESFQVKLDTNEQKIALKEKQLDELLALVNDLFLKVKKQGS